MITETMAKLTAAYLAWSARMADHRAEEDGFEIAQSMGIALLGLVVAAAFATALQALGVDIINRIRSELGL
ncbi:MAG: hypothetical protein OEW29_00485 [Acidimicrobiia bacterium]|nr:hypothetical protein [Acidimicrobiia bacterium]